VKIDKVTQTILLITLAGVFTILFTMMGLSTIGGLVLVFTGTLLLMFVLQDSLATDKGTEIELATRGMFALAALLVGLYNIGL